MKKRLCDLESGDVFYYLESDGEIEIKNPHPTLLVFKGIKGPALILIVWSGEGGFFRELSPTITVDHSSNYIFKWLPSPKDWENYAHDFCLDPTKGHLKPKDMKVVGQEMNKKNQNLKRLGDLDSGDIFQYGPDAEVQYLVVAQTNRSTFVGDPGGFCERVQCDRMVQPSNCDNTDLDFEEIEAATFIDCVKNS